MKTVILIRHGESEHHVNGLTGGWTDTDLTTKGRTQIGTLARRLQIDLPKDESMLLYASDLKRTQQTAEIISAELKLPVLLTPALREMNNGRGAGLREEEARRIANPKPATGFLTWQHYPEAETWMDFYCRVAGFMAEREKDVQRRMILVTHRGTVVNILLWWLGLTPEGREKLPVSLEVAPAGITVLTVNRWGERTIERLNDTAHLYAAGIAGAIQC